MGEIAARQAILHGVIAAAFVEGALRAWRIRGARRRLPFWILALAFPFVVLPVLLLTAPFRSGDLFAARWAILSSDRWNAVQVAGRGVDTLVFASLALVGTALFLRDAVPLLLEAVRKRREETGTGTVAADDLVRLVADLAHQIDTRSPHVVVLQSAEHVLFVRGVFTQALVVSEGTVARLSRDELRAAIVHELAHLRFRDPLIGWVLMAARLVMFWNPAVQLVARAIAQEMEHRADDVAARLAGGAQLTSALGLLGSSDARSRHRGAWSAALERLHEAHLQARVEAFSVVDAPLELLRTRLALAGVSLAAILFFVV